MKEYKELVQLEVEEHDVLKLFNQLGPNAKNIVIHILERLAKGAKQYGDFDDQRRDWDKESSEEALDLAVYQAAKLLGLGKETGKGRPKLQTAREYTAPDGVRVSLDGRTSDGMPWVPPPGARVRVVYQPEYGRVDSIVGRTLTVERVKQVQKPIGTIHDGIIEIVFEGLADDFPYSRDVRVVPA